MNGKSIDSSDLQNSNAPTSPNLNPNMDVGVHEDFSNYTIPIEIGLPKDNFFTSSNTSVISVSNVSSDINVSFSNVSQSTGNE